MVISSAVNRRDIWAASFRRCKSTGAYTKLIEDLDNEARASLLASVAMRDDELPILGARPQPSDWLLLTTERLLFCKADIRCAVELADLCGITPAYVRTDERRMRKEDMAELDLHLANGDVIPVQIEPGPPLFAIWTILMNVCRRHHGPNRESQRQS